MVWFENSGRPDAVKILVVVAQTKSSDDVNRAARDLRNSGVNILSAWYTKSGAHGDDLKSIVSPPKHYNLFRDDSSLENLAEHIVKRIRYGMFSKLRSLKPGFHMVVKRVRKRVVTVLEIECKPISTTVTTRLRPYGNQALIQRDANSISLLDFHSFAGCDVKCGKLG